MKYCYNIFGLKIGSAIKLGPYPLAKKHKKYDVKIYSQKITKPRANQDHVIYKPGSCYTNEFYYLDIQDVARYKIEGSDTVYIQKHKNGTWKDTVTFFLDTVLTVLLIKNNKFIFHASAVLLKGKAYIFCCGAGNGKSTLAMFLNRRGFKIIEDDKCLIEWDEKKGDFFIRNGYPFLELWKPQVNPLRKGIKDKAVGKVRNNIQKYRFDISALVPKKKFPVGKIFLIALDNYDNEDIIKTELKGIHKINTMIKYSHLDYLINALGKGKDHFKFIAKVSSKLHVEKISRSRLTKFNDFSTFIINDISVSTTN